MFLIFVIASCQNITSFSTFSGNNTKKKSWVDLAPGTNANAENLKEFILLHFP